MCAKTCEENIYKESSSTKFFRDIIVTSAPINIQRAHPEKRMSRTFLLSLSQK